MVREPRWEGGWYVVPWQVIFRDIDTFGHVNNAVYLTYFELARTSMWLALTGGSGSKDVGFIVARTECDFRHQLEMEPIEIRVRIGDMRTTSFDTLYEIWSDRGRQLAATGRVVVVLFDWGKNHKTPITDELRQKVRMFQKVAE
ncbi:MAG: esterase [Acidobacteria bacterium]|nr:MAG: esterase [Acidobacteriota bacterium]